MSDFQDRLQRAINRGRQSRNASEASSAGAQASEEDLRNRHSQLRTSLSEHIESCLKQLADQFPGFDYATIVNNEDGWGARITRDDIELKSGSSRNLYSRLEMLIRPFSSAHILEISTKGTVRNRESLNRSKFQFLIDADEPELKSMIDLLVLEFAEQYASASA